MQFSPQLDLLRAGEFASRIRDEFPVTEERPAQPPMEERFDKGGVAPRFTIQVMDRPLARFWFLSEDGSRLIQLQNDLLAFNWRKRDEDGTYPRYDFMRESVERYLGVLEEVLSDEGRDKFGPNWVEVSFVNHIETGESGHSKIEKLMTPLQPATAARFLPESEETEFAQRFRITRDGEPVGRLHVNVSPAFRASDELPIWILGITARIRSEGKGREKAIDTLDTAHDWVVRAFADMTTNEMHGLWKRESA